MNTTIIATLLALAPSTSPPAEFDVSDIEFKVGDRSAHLLAFDADGEVSAEVITWVDDDDRPRVDAVFADGLYLSVVVTGEHAEIDSDNAAEVAARVEAINQWLAENPQQGHEVPCAIATVETVWHGATASPWVLVSAYVAACTCLPLLVEEWEDYACPGFG